MSAKTSGADAANGSASNRAHNQGNQDRTYTVEQKAAVIRVRRCRATAFYDILGLEAVKTTCTESEIKKAYRKLSLLTHPDKNGHEHADEAFKMVSRAFGVLSDADKRAKYDRFGGDPESRFGGGSAPSASPFSGGGFGGRPQAGGGRGWDEEISPEEMFNRFFGGGGGMGGMGGGFGPFGGGMFDAGPQFVFNLGGGPGIRVHQFGGGRPRARPQSATNGPQTPQSLGATLAGLLPLLILLVIPVLSSIFSSSTSTSSGPAFRFNSEPPYTKGRVTKKFGVSYFVNPADVESLSSSKWKQLDQRADILYVQDLRIKCEAEHQQRQRAWDAAQGWFFQDVERAQAAKNMEMRHCQRLNDMGVGMSSY